jgi:hypothetical protein
VAPRPATASALGERGGAARPCTAAAVPPPCRQCRSITAAPPPESFHRLRRCASPVAASPQERSRHFPPRSANVRARSARKTVSTASAPRKAGLIRRPRGTRPSQRALDSRSSPAAVARQHAALPSTLAFLLAPALASFAAACLPRTAAAATASALARLDSALLPCMHARAASCSSTPHSLLAVAQLAFLSAQQHLADSGSPSPLCFTTSHLAPGT